MDKLKLLKNTFSDDVDGRALTRYLPNVGEALKTLTEREQLVLERRYSGMTLKTTGLELLNMRDKKTPGQGVSTERVRQIEAKALRKLRNPRLLSIFFGENTAFDFFNPIETQPQSPSPELLARAEEFKAYSIDKMELSVRSWNCLRNAQVNTVGQLILKTENDLLHINNFGRKSLSEIKMILWDMGLGLMKG
jgi:hypothetical protein